MLGGIGKSNYVLRAERDFHLSTPTPYKLFPSQIQIYANFCWDLSDMLGQLQLVYHPDLLTAPLLTQEPI